MNQFCCIIETGAKISLLSESAFKICAEMDSSLELTPCTSKLRSLRQDRTSILDYVSLKLNLVIPDSPLVTFCCC